VTVTPISRLQTPKNDPKSLTTKSGRRGIEPIDLIANLFLDGVRHWQLSLARARTERKGSPV
jgi:hypothetical protein